MLSKVGSVLIALGLILGFPGSISGWIIAAGVLGVGFGIGNLIDQQKRSRELTELRELISMGTSLSDVREFVEERQDLVTEAWLAEFPWPPLPADTEDAFYFQKNEAIARLGIIDGKVACVSVFWKSDYT